METIIKNIKKDFNGKFSIKKKRPDIYQLYLPIYHEDGDMVDLFIKQNDDNSFELCDYGLTLQRLAYSYDIDTDNKESILLKILSENNLSEHDGNICLKTKTESLYSDIMHITQAFAKIGSMSYFKREVIENLFFEMLDDFVFDNLNDFNPKKDVLPLPDREDLEADYSFQPNGKPVYLFGVKDVAKARLATLSYQAYLLKDIKYHGWVVTENFEALPRKDKLRLTNSCDKQFTSLDEFKINARKFLEKERY